MRWAVAGGSLILVTGCLGGTEPFIPPRPADAVDVTLELCNEPVTWFAYKNEGVDWVAYLIPGGFAKFTFPAGPRVTVATGRASSTTQSFVSEIDIRNLARDDVAAFRCRATTAGTMSMSGAIKTDSTDDFTRIAFGDASDVSIGNQTYSFFGLTAGTRDLIAVNRGLISPDSLPARIIVRNGLSVAHQGTFALLDFTSVEAHAFERRRVKVTGSLGLSGYTEFHSSRGTTALLEYAGSAADEILMPVVPSHMMESGSRHRFELFGPDRGVTFYQSTPRDTTLDPGPAIATATLDTIAGSAFRPRIRLAKQGEYPSFAEASYIQTAQGPPFIARAVRVLTTAGYLGSAAQWDLSIPDLARSGVPASWLLSSAVKTFMEVSAHQARLELRFGGERGDLGETMRWVRRTIQ